MTIGILWALTAGLMLGLYAIPAKFTKDFAFENTWGLFFMLTMFVITIVATLVVMTGVGAAFSAVPTGTLGSMVGAGVLWVVVVMVRS